ncbi:MAG: carbon-nitrogen hydrolase family protein [Alphaproteobacteria bacterium]|nr:carbon-nitrogen hydrolase family protein [Alphaproteobacteria bacterium]
MPFNVACIQTNCQDDLGQNVVEVMPLVEKAAQAGADLICLPENAFLMEDQGKKLFQKAVPLLEHPGIIACSTLARLYGAWILIGSVPVRDTKKRPITPDMSHTERVLAKSQRPSEKVFNTSILIDDKGMIIRDYQKIHLFDVDLPNGESYRESNRFSAGKAAPVVDLPWGKMGLSICYDVRFPQLYRDLAHAGAEMLAIPAAFTQTTGEGHWHVLQRARAIENSCFVFAAAQWGVHPGNRKTYGHSLIIDPWGKVLADGGEGEKVIMATIDMDEVRKTREKIPSLNNDREYKIC